MNEETMLKLSVFEQKAKNLQEQYESLENGIIQLKEMNLGLEDLKDSVGKEIMAQVGRGVFIKAKIISEDLFVDLGNGNFVKKNIIETNNILDKQVNHLKTIQGEIKTELEKLNEELDEIIKEN